MTDNDRDAMPVMGGRVAWWLDVNPDVNQYIIELTAYTQRMKDERDAFKERTEDQMKDLTRLNSEKTDQWLRAESAERREREVFERTQRALERIERWAGEFPQTGMQYKDGTPMSYRAVYGSNGERDYMRGVAREALQAIRTLQPEQPEQRTERRIEKSLIEQMKQAKAIGVNECRRNAEQRTEGEGEKA